MLSILPLRLSSVNYFLMVAFSHHYPSTLFRATPLFPGQSAYGSTLPVSLLMMPCELTRACEQTVSQHKWIGLSSGKHGTIAKLLFSFGKWLKRKQKVFDRRCSCEEKKGIPPVRHSSCDLALLISPVEL